MFDNIISFFEEKRLPKFRFKQLEKAVLNEFVLDFDNITVFPKSLRDELRTRFGKVTSLSLFKMFEAEDTAKFVLRAGDDNLIECVLMRHEDRNTVCVSSQVFCPVGCKFCATGANKFRRNLSCDEIVEQVLFASNFLKKKNDRVDNIVFMGMGEPFLNYENVIESIKILNDENFFNIGARHITVSTVGIVPKIYDFAKFSLQCRLAISLHAADDELRNELIPINKQYPVSEVMKAVDFFIKEKGKRVTIEYVLIDGVNDSIKCAEKLCDLLKGRMVLVNLIVYNPHEFSKFRRPSKDKVERFKRVLDGCGINVTIRRSMGGDFLGACGQLSGGMESY